MRLKDAKDVTKLVKTAVRILINQLKGERALVILSAGGNMEPQPTAFYGFESEDVWKDPTVPVMVLKTVLQRRKPACFADARAESRIQNKQCYPSVICIPVKGGLIYCDHSEPGYFSHTLRDQVRRVGKEFDERLAELEGGSSGGASEGRVSKSKLKRVNTLDEPSDFRIRRHNTFDWHFAIQIITVLFSLGAFAIVIWMMFAFGK